MRTSPLPRATPAAAILLLAFLAQACGGGDSFFPRHHWVSPPDISGRWATGVLPVEITGGGPRDVARKSYSLVQDGGLISGEYTEEFRDGSLFSGPLSGVYDAGTGLLVLSHDSPTYGRVDWYFRFESGSAMWQVSPHDTDIGLLLFFKA